MQGNIDVDCAKHNYGDAHCRLEAKTESDYDFRERIFDATQLAANDCRISGGIQIVRADWNKRQVYTVPEGPFTDLASAYEYLGRSDNGDPHYIIGADIEDL